MSEPGPFTVGIMKMEVEGRDSGRFDAVVDRAVPRLRAAFAFDALLSRDRRLAESSVVTAAVTILCLLATLIVMFCLFGALMYLVIVTVFPARLMESWPGAGSATATLDHVKLSLFLAGMGVLAGSLGGRSDSRDLVRGVLFVTEDT